MFSDLKVTLAFKTHSGRINEENERLHMSEFYYLSSRNYFGSMDTNSRTHFYSINHINIRYFRY